MKIGITLTPSANSPSVVARAEAAGLASAFFVDSPVLFGDPYVSMGAAAALTKKITFGVGVTNPLTRSAPVTAAACAALNAMAPARVVLGLGTGYTATAAMGQRSAKVEELERYIQDVRCLLAGEVAEVELSQKPVPVQLLNRERPFMNLADPVPIYVAAAGPRVLALAGRLGDGVILGGAADPTVVDACWRHVEGGIREAGRNPAAVNITATAAIYVTDKTPTFEELVAKLGSSSFLTAVTYGRFLETAESVSAELRRDFSRLRKAYEERADTDPDKRTQHLRRYSGHRKPLEAWQLPLMTQAILEATTIAGTIEQCHAKMRRLEAQGVGQLLAVALPDNLDAVIDALGRAVAR